ncbi:MAG: hypothetical protein E5299_01494 [Burkholderia gladioli]|nr:MAG: hypothetical protein E5299_01494 [Burkholderia gladioli]
MNYENVRMLFQYTNGALYWQMNRGSNAKVGQRAGRQLKTGYRSIHVGGKKYQEHRLVWLWHHGIVPRQIDHINGNKSDNRIENLREINSSQNQINTSPRKSESGNRGVRRNPRNGKWISRIYRNGKEIRIGTFLTKKEATEAYQAKAAELYFGFTR